MAYCTRDETEKQVGPENFLLMLDDDKDGVEDAGLFDALAQAASEQVDAYLAAQYAVPFASPPDFVKVCAKAFLAESLYMRRGISKEANPWTGQAQALRARLERVASGKDKLALASDTAGHGVNVQTEPSRLAQDGALMF